MLDEIREVEQLKANLLGKKDDFDKEVGKLKANDAGTWVEERCEEFRGVTVDIT